MKRVLYLITKDDVGGAQKYVSDLASHLDPGNFEAMVSYGGTGKLSALSNAFRPYFLFANDWVAIFQIYKLLRELKPDILHLNSSKAGVLGALGAALYRKFSRKPLRVVFTAHGWVFNPTNALSPFRRRFYIALHRFAARFQDVIISVSDYDQTLAYRYGIAPPKKLFVVRNGIDFDALHFLSKLAAREALLFQSKLIDKEIWIGSIGRLVPEKNYETLVRAAALTPPHFRFFVIGGGREYVKLQRIIESLGLHDRFKIIPDIAPAAPYLTAFDIFILTSIKEGLPYTLIEAMAARVPVITTSVGGMTEIVKDHGILVPPREYKQIAEAIQKAMKTPSEIKERAHTAYEFARRELNVQDMTKKTAALYAS